MSAINNINYYADLAAEDYYTTGGEPAGVWAGQGARLLKLQGQVDVADYHRIFNGYAPDGRALCERPGDKHSPGWDLTFSAPKSVSTVWARANIDTRKAIQAGQLKAVRQALCFLEQHAAITRRGHGGHEQEPVIGVIAALFEHSTSRAQDFQLHTHCLVANVSPRHDETWGTLVSRNLFLWQKAAGAVYRATLANHLRELGFDITQPEGESHFEVAGIPKRICDYFSKRADAIRALMKTLNVTNSASKIGDKLTLNTRQHKQVIDRPTLFAKWHKELDEQGLYAEHIGALRQSLPEINPTPLPLSIIVEQLVEKQAVFRLQDIYTAVAVEAQYHHANLHEIESAVKELIAEHELVSLGRDHVNNQLFTTPAMLALERELITQADILSKQDQYSLSESCIQAAINKQAMLQGFALSDEQVEAVFSVCQSGLEILQGAAGTGKSTSMQATRLAYEAAGFTVQGAAVARQAAKQLENETGIVSTTVAKLLLDISGSQTKLANTVVLVDEAGLLSSPDLLELMSSVRRAGGKLILVGEQQQLEAITHSGSLRYLSQRQGCAKIEIIRRQREDWAREAVRQLRAGDALPALLSHKQRGLLNMAVNGEETREQLVRKWHQYSTANPDKQAVILAQRWRDVKLLNELVRQTYQQLGNVGTENIITECIVSNQVMQLAFSTGDRVRFTRNDYRHEFTNGEQGTIVNINKQNNDIRFTITTDSGHTVSFNQSDYSDEKRRLYLVHAYATTVYASQGSTIDGDTFVLYTTGMDRANSYVAGSRHKDNCHWFVNGQELDALSGQRDNGSLPTEQVRLATMAKCMSVNKQKYMAIEYISEHEKTSSKIYPEKSMELEMI